MAKKSIGRMDFRCEPSAIGGGRYDVAIETAASPYVKVSAVLKKREVLALIECLGVGLREGEQGNEGGAHG